MTEADKDFFIRLFGGAVALTTPHNEGEDWRDTAAHAEGLLREYLSNDPIDALEVSAEDDLARS